MPDNITEVFLRPGEFYFGEANSRIRTLLGSCVAITLWHPRKRIGGMCHYMLSHSLTKHLPHKSLDGRYAEGAVQLFLRELCRSCTYSSEYHVKIFGGGNMFNNILSHKENIGERNVRKAYELLHKYGFTVHSQHWGGEGYRRIIFDVWSGNVWMKHSPPFTYGQDKGITDKETTLL